MAGSRNRTTSNQSSSSASSSASSHRAGRARRAGRGSRHQSPAGDAHGGSGAPSTSPSPSPGAPPRATGLPVDQPDLELPSRSDHAREPAENPQLFNPDDRGLIDPDQSGLAPEDLDINQSVGRSHRAAQEQGE